VTSIHKGKASFLQPSIRIDVRWALDGLFEDGRISERDMNFVSGQRREKQELNWNPLQFIAKFNLDDQQFEHRKLDLDNLTEWLAKRADQPLYHIDPLKVDVGATTAVMSFQFAERHEILAVAVDDDTVTITSGQPFLNEWEQGLEQTLKGKRIRRVITNPADIRRFTLEFYNLARSVKGAAGGKGPSNVTNFEQLLQLGELTSPDANDQHIVKIVDWLLQYAFDQRASDIHLEPRREHGNIRFRIDGVLHDVYELPAPVMAAVTSRIKILGRMDVAEKRRPQDGRLKTKSTEGDEVELRLSTLPTAFGEKMVMRIFDPEVLVRSSAQMGLADDDYERWNNMVTQPNGIVLVTGPTGSGKTTTLYSTLKQLATREVNVCTIEDPIEMVEPSFNQMQVMDNVDLTFADGVKALLRQDPDIIMVGEIRNLETANMAIQAALTGHLVISTLHTNDAPSAIVRLTDLGVPSYMISATLLGVMAQRLVRTLCPHCKRDTYVDPDVWHNLIHPWKGKQPEKIKSPVGCLECRKTGYLGRVGIYEVMPLSQELKDMISHDAELNELRKQAMKEGMRTLRLSGAQKVAAGLTTPEEVLRVAPVVGGA
jgi:general secretion pathway protein E|tara:strand:+ start:4536 stop:6332 length:1797 start_codon:yes stop_codon:yes gene_type:complete